MTAPPKPPRARRAARPVLLAPFIAVVPETLTREEQLLIGRYRATAPVWRPEIVDFAHTVSKMYPLVVEVRPPAPAAVRLATDDGKQVP